MFGPACTGRAGVGTSETSDLQRNFGTRLSVRCGMPVIETAGLTKRYGKLLAVDAISFSVEKGQVFGFLGPNGSGKTTTIGMLLGIITPTAGDVRLLGLTGRDGLHKARQRIGATLETPNFYPHLSGWDNLQIVANLKRVERRRIEETFELVGLFARRKDRFRA